MSRILAVGTLAVGTSQVVQAVPTDGTATSEVIKIVVQAVIAVVTLLFQWKKYKSDKNPKTN